MDEVKNEVRSGLTVVEDKRGGEEPPVADHDSEIVPEELVPRHIRSVIGNSEITYGKLKEIESQMAEARKQIYSSDKPDHIADVMLSMFHEDVVLSPLQLAVMRDKIIAVLSRFGNQFGWSTSYTSIYNGGGQWIDGGDQK